jgi:putative hydrolase of the HAD superfamily
MNSEEEMWARWLTCRWVRDFERGRCSDVEFAAGVVADWDLPLSGPEFLEMFKVWPEALLDGAAELVSEVRGLVAVGCVSNSNIPHWHRMTSLWGLDKMFDYTFLSHEMGYVKPDRELFDSVAATLKGHAERLVFLDDNEVNVVQARAAGFRAARVRGPDEARAALATMGVLATSAPLL